MNADIMAGGTFAFIGMSLSVLQFSRIMYSIFSDYHVANWAQHCVAHHPEPSSNLINLAAAKASEISSSTDAEASAFA
jgi:hypothetical protein